MTLLIRFKLLFLPIALLYMLVMLSCGESGSDGGDIIDNIDYKLSGYAQHNGQGVEGIRVELSGDKSKETTTDKNGYYKLGFREGTYSVTINSDDYLCDPRAFGFKVYDLYWFDGPVRGGGSNIWKSGKSASVDIELFPLQTDSGIAYTGSTSRSYISSSNAEEILIAAYLGGTDKNIGHPRLTRVAPTLASLLSALDIGYDESKTEIIAGDCGGTGNCTVSSDSAGNFSGTATLSNYCYEGMKISGNVSYMGGLSSDYFTIQEFLFDPLVITSERDSFTISGDMVITYGNSITISFKLLFIKDSDSSNVYLLEDFSIDGVVYTDRLEFKQRGKFYHPDYGYSSLSVPTKPGTNNPFTFSLSNEADYPSEGGLVARSDGHTARLLSLSEDSYQIELDTDDDPSDWEVDLGIKSWP
jgi:hypothetical protein